MQSGQKNSDSRFWMGVSQHLGGEELAILLRAEDSSPRNCYIVTPSIGRTSFVQGLKKIKLIYLWK